MKHVKIKISGKVQGVFFRASAKDKARELEVRGFVCNEPDGSVYVEAEGEEEALNQFVAWCSKGPVGAQVGDVMVIDGVLENHSHFEIRRK
jgi:acylphosphatase